ncbi:hypothetical protein PG990_010518 [Apiospora arundinis]
MVYSLLKHGTYVFGAFRLLCWRREAVPDQVKLDSTAPPRQRQGAYLVGFMPVGGAAGDNPISAMPQTRSKSDEDGHLVR